jgi:hypothetical protein
MLHLFMSFFGRAEKKFIKTVSPFHAFTRTLRIRDVPGEPPDAV